MVKSQKHGTGKVFATANKVVERNQTGPDLPRPVQSLKNSRRLAPKRTRCPTPRMPSAAAMMEMEVLKDRKWCRWLFAAQRSRHPTKGATRRLVMSLFFGSGASRCAHRPLPPREVLASKKKESGRGALLIGHPSIPVLTRLVCNLA